MRSVIGASTRLRLFPAFLGAEQLGAKPTFGQAWETTPDVCFVGKLGFTDLKALGDHWLSMLNELKRLDKKVVVDYTDHHLGDSGELSKFYAKLIELSDRVICPNAVLASEMKRTLRCGSDVIQIPDLSEYRCKTPSIRQKRTSLRLVWFGHQSNIPALVNWINSVDRCVTPIELVVVSSLEGLKELGMSVSLQSDLMKISPLPWSVEILPKVASKVDAALIVTDLNGRKRFASSNRLITALGLGLPTIATLVPSYEEFAPYFCELRGDSFFDFLNRLDEFEEKVVAFQGCELNKFSLDTLAPKWAEALLSW